MGKLTYYITYPGMNQTGNVDCVEKKWKPNQTRGFEHVFGGLVGLRGS